MKHLCTLFIIIFLCISLKTDAQYGEFKQGLLVRKTFYDYNTFRHKDAAAIIDFQNGFEIAYVRNFSSFASVIIPVGAGIFKEEGEEFKKTSFFTFGAQAQLHMFKTNRWANPFATAGVQALLPKDGDIAVQIPLGLGVQFMLHPQVYLHWQSDFRLSIANWEDHLQHNFGFVYLFGGKKT